MLPQHSCVALTSRVDHPLAQRVLVTMLSGDPDICVTRNASHLHGLQQRLDGWWMLNATQQAAAFLGSTREECDFTSTLQVVLPLPLPPTCPTARPFKALRPRPLTTCRHVSHARYKLHTEC